MIELSFCATYEDWPWMNIRVLQALIWAFRDMVKLGHLNTTIESSILRQKETRPRAQFMSLPGLFAIFSNSVYSNV